MANLTFHPTDFDAQGTTEAHKTVSVFRRLGRLSAGALERWTQARSHAKMMQIAQSDPRIARDLQIARDRQEWLK